jgi:hypothetical protein
VADDKIFVEMLLANGESGDIRWFEYRPSYFGDIVRIEWGNDTMVVDVPFDYAHYLTTNGYARAMTEKEIEAYTAPVETKSTKPKKETTHDRSSLSGDV